MNGLGIAEKAKVSRRDTHLPNYVGRDGSLVGAHGVRSTVCGVNIW